MPCYGWFLPRHCGFLHTNNNQSLKQAKGEVARKWLTRSGHWIGSDWWQSPPGTGHCDVPQLGLFFLSMLRGPAQASRALMQQTQPTAQAPVPTRVSLGKGDRESGIHVLEEVLLQVETVISFLAPDGFCSCGMCMCFLEPAELIIVVSSLPCSASSHTKINRCPQVGEARLHTWEAKDPVCVSVAAVPNYHKRGG